MVDITIAILWFCISLGINSLLYRVYKQKKSLIVAMNGIYFLGIPFILFYNVMYPSPGTHLTATSCLLSLLLSLTAVFFLMLNNGDYEKPLDVLVHIIPTKESWTKKELSELFSEDDLIGKHIEHLERYHIVYKKKENYVLTHKGIMLFYLFTFFCKCTGMEAKG